MSDANSPVGAYRKRGAIAGPVLEVEDLPIRPSQYGAIRCDSHLPGIDCEPAVVGLEERFFAHPHAGVIDV